MDWRHVLRDAAEGKSSQSKKLMTCLLHDFPARPRQTPQIGLRTPQDYDMCLFGAQLGCSLFSSLAW